MSANEEACHLYIDNEYSWYTFAREQIKAEPFSLERATTRVLAILPERHYEARFNRKVVRSYLKAEREEWERFRAHPKNQDLREVQEYLNGREPSQSI